jgi:protein-S-isoprenylcysteine O-methyltransferase Ste14
VPFIVVPVFLALIHYRFVLREEPFMAERFGEACDAYRTVSDDGCKGAAV